MKMTLNKIFIIKILWLQSWAALFGSLYFSEIMKLPPCVLCWYQRVCMYPLAVIFLIGVALKDTKAFIYALPLTIIGWLIAFYHTLLYYAVIPESAAPCSAGVSCTTQQLMLFGFISIPLMSLVAFSIVVIGIWVGLKAQND